MAQHPANIRRAKPWLGTFVEISAAANSFAELEPAVEAAFDAIAKVHELMSFHEPGSDVSRLNRHACTAAIDVHPWTYQVLQSALEINRCSGGIFDISIATALQRLAVLPSVPSSPVRDYSHSFTESAGPLETAAEELAPNPSAAIELLGDGHVRFRKPDVLID